MYGKFLSPPDKILHLDGIILPHLLDFPSKETFYKANRFFLISALLISAILPLFPFTYTVLVNPEQSTSASSLFTNTIQDIRSDADQNLKNGYSIGFIEGISLIYFTGILIFLFRILIQSFILVSLILKNRIKIISGIRIVENKKYGLPFSFFNVVFINPKFHTQDNLPEILAHEKVHICENHWFDLLLIELLTVIFWFNPIIWFFERSIKQNHEYLADKGVVTQGHNVGRYQALLLNQLMGMQIIGITNNLNFALNTNRLKMMTKKKTPKIKRFKFVWALPVIALLLFAFAKPDYRMTETKNGTSVIPPALKGEKEFVISGTVTEEKTGEPLPGATLIIKGSPIGTVADINGKYTLTDPSPVFDQSTGSYTSVIVVSFVGYQTVENKVTASGEALKNGKFSFKLKRELVTFDPDLFVDASTAPPPPPPPALNIDENTEGFYIVEDMPQYPGGPFALTKYINEKIAAYKNSQKISGETTVTFTINVKGAVTNINVVKKDNDNAAKAAYVIISEMENWTPGKQRGKPVSVDYVVPVNF